MTHFGPETYPDTATDLRFEVRMAFSWSGDLYFWGFGPGGWGSALNPKPVLPIGP